MTGVVQQQTGRSVGRAGFHAAPDADGMLEVGYAIDPDHRRRGYARAALALMVERPHRAGRGRAARHRLPTNAPSLALIHEHPFLEVGEQWDDEDGLGVHEMPVG